MPHLAIFGVTGRMGQAILRLLRQDGGWQLSGAVASPHSPRLGQDAAVTEPPCGVRVTSDPASALEPAQGIKAAVALDFSSAAALPAHLEACRVAGVPLLVGTTGLSAGQLRALEQAAGALAVLLAPNTSIGVGVMAELVRAAGRALPKNYDVEIHEAHHRMKRDAPSGTALRLGEVVAAARSQQLADVAVYDRHGVHAARSPGSIGFSVVRAGDIIGEHTVIFAGDGERLEITHRAADRDLFARGALRAAAWLAGRPPGMYSMQDVLTTQDMQDV